MNKQTDVNYCKCGYLIPLDRVETGHRTCMPCADREARIEHAQLTAAYQAALAAVDVASQALDAARQTVRAATDTREALKAMARKVGQQMEHYLERTNKKFTSEDEHEHE